MRSKEYNNYMQRKNLIITKFNLLNMKKNILETLNQMGINTNNKDVSYLVSMIEKVLFDLEMYGDIKTIDIINKNKNHLYTTDDIEKLSKSNINIPYKNLESNSFKQFIMCCAYNTKSNIKE